MKKRKVELAVISDVHLGTYGCHAKELSSYLASIQPNKLILNGDIIDMWQFKKRYWPKSHNSVIKQLFKLLENGTEIFYITGNHDDRLRKHSGILLGGLNLVDSIELEIKGKKHLFLHGDIFDMVVQNNRWLSILGGYSYDILVLLNRVINHGLAALGKGPMSFSKRIKNSVKGAVQFISNFEQTVINYAIDNEVDAIVCGHIHQPKIKTFITESSAINYLNSGDWVENCTSLEFSDGKWEIHHHTTIDINQKISQA